MPNDAVTVQSVHDEVFVVSRHPMKFSQFGDIPRLAAAQLPRLRKELQDLGVEQAGPDDFSQWTTLRDLAEQNGLTRSLVEREVVLAYGDTLADSVIELQEGVE